MNTKNIVKNFIVYGAINEIENQHRKLFDSFLIDKYYNGNINYFY